MLLRTIINRFSNKKIRASGLFRIEQYLTFRLTDPG